MKIIKTTLVAFLAASLIGCAVSPTAGTTKDVVVTAPVCCNAYSEFSWVPMQGNQIDFAIDDYSQVGEFPEGKSYFAAFALPANVQRMQVDLKSWMRSTGVLAPKVILLNSNFEPVETIELNDFDVKMGGIFSLASYQYRVEMDQTTTPYMVVYSPQEYRKGEIQIPHPERLRAEDLGLARPMVIDPVIQHQKFGSLELGLKPLNLRSYRANEVAAAAAPLVQKATVNNAASAKMLPETEAFYNTQIKAAVGKNDMHKALQLLDEAKRAGSSSAESTFVELIKK
ncbi:MalM family protein [Moritella yayanosii]|uniref:Putative maltose regulon periplasmic protein, malM n=1 Tax=Moritella yayanosii TaxID=69539 RepID=A0A330LN14_9GAMM|nr:MalM family protein [Moritella yayanosii]SQD78250.1 putative maltose regulon periplasmic protein, malM [Moritella yayanosii]